MLPRGIEMRLRKLEGARRTGVFFLAWGHSDAEIDQRLSEAKAVGIIGTGDTVVKARWTGRNGSPPSRWIAGRDLSPEENEVLVAEMERRITAREWAADEPVSPQLQEKLRRMSDAELFAAGLGERVS